MQYDFLHNMYKMPVSMVKNIHNENELIDTIRNNFTVSHAKNFISYSKLSINTWSKILPISMRTLQRSLDNKKKALDITVSETFIEIGEIYNIGLSAFNNDKDRLNDWFFTGNAYFNHKKPIDIMDTHKGRDLIKSELTRIEYSEFS